MRRYQIQIEIHDENGDLVRIEYSNYSSSDILTEEEILSLHIPMVKETVEVPKNGYFQLAFVEVKEVFRVYKVGRDGFEVHPAEEFS